MNLPPSLNSVRAVIGFCTFMVIAVGLMVCGFITSGHYVVAILFLLVMIVYVLLLRRMWSYS
jgi:hypothetical protein